MTDTNLSEEDIRRIVRNELSEQLGTLSDGPNQIETETLEVEQMTESVMTVRDLRRQERDGLSAVETLRRRYGVDAEEFDAGDRDGLASAVSERCQSNEARGRGV